ncbi:MAG TPA: hypothetical protein DIW47_11380 [Bacteroidetes bacterium]|nr:hypothetical protein [Bacteroidota bacterium]
MRKQYFRFLKIGLCCFSFYLQAQEIPDAEEEKIEDHSSFVAFRFGTNVAGKGFNSDAVISPQVNAFLSYALEGAWLPHRNIGLMLSLQQHRFTNGSPDPFSRKGYIVGQTEEDWVTNQMLAGLYLSKPFLNIDLEGRFLAGPGKTSAFTKRYERQKSPFYDQSITYSGSALWYQAGMTVRIDKQPGWSVAFNYDLNFAEHPVHSKEVYGGSLSGEVFSESTSKLRFSVISFSVLYAIPHYK